MDKAVLIVKRSEEVPIACVIIANRASPYLKVALETFVHRFVTVSREDLRDTAEISKFARSKGLVTECIPFVPSYN